MNPFLLSGKRILVTGASSGIGRQSAILFSELGARVILSARRESELDVTLKRLHGHDHSLLVADLTDDSDIDSLVENIENIDGVVHSAGIVRPFPVKFIGGKQIDQMFGINYHGPVILMSKLFKKKKVNDNASVVFMSSISSRFPHKGGALYSGTKAAINSFSKTIALEYASKRIRSNVIEAAMVRTPLFDEAEKAVSKEMMDKHGEHYPLGFGEPEDVANTAAFLLSDASRWITGTEIVMDGGLTAGQ